MNKKEIRKRISVLRGELRRTDYKAIKYAEGELSFDEFAPTRAERAAWRAEINDLQAELKAMVSANATTLNS